MFNVASGEAISILELADRVNRTFLSMYPSRPPLRTEIVTNPRQGIELVEPAFAVDRSATELALGVTCRHHVDEELPMILRGPVAFGPISR